MTENELVLIIGMLCSSLKDTEDRVQCINYYSNCAIKGYKIYSKKELIDKCLVFPDQFKMKKT